MMTMDEAIGGSEVNVSRQTLAETPCADSRSSRPFGAGRFGLFPGYWGFSSLGSTGGVRDESVPP